MNFSDMIRSSPFYRAVLEQVPEDERRAVEEQLSSIMRHYDTITAALPGESMTEISRAMAPDESSGSIDSNGTQPMKRSPRRF